ncbi:MAG: NAD(P)-dependent oxidoreductase [Chloroflexota bacterium]|nr:NAD(P)-dependent oxidoreductase [Chloroflexota bacterium]
MRFLVTGGAGFVGHTVVRSLLQEGHQVRVLDKVAGRLAGLAHPGLELLRGGVEETDKVRRAVDGVEVVYHMAESFLSDPIQVFDIDVRGTLNLLEASAQAGVRHFLFTSTARVYGKPRSRRVNELHPLMPEQAGQPLYAVSKVTAEKLCLLYGKERQLPVTIFRFWWAYFSEIGGRALRNMADAALRGQVIRVPQEAGGSFLHNDDTALALRLATLNEKAFGQAFNLSSGFYTTWEEMARMVHELAASSSPIEVVSRQEWTGHPSVGTDSNIPDVWDLDIAQARRLLGFRPCHSPRKGKEQLKEALAWLVEGRKAQK